MMMNDIKLAIAEIQQPRSRFQLERFVLGQHATPEMQYYQTCLELQDLFHKYETAKIEVKISQIKISKLKATGDEIDELKAQKLELGLQQTKLAMIGAEREIADLIDIWKSFEHKYTRDEIEAAQPFYWQARLTNNAEAMVLGQGSVNYAHIEAMNQAGILDEYLEQKRVSGELLNLE